MRIGVDEAGKGPVLGSMFAAAVRADAAALPEGVGDSKTIAPARREALAAEIRSCADAVAVAEVPVERIDDPETDMNTLTVDAHAQALAGVVTEIAGDLACLVDAGDTDAGRFGRRVAEGAQRNGAAASAVTVEARHGADEDDALVGAASIVAKVARDAHVEALAADYDERHGDLGSGYPSDPATREFLRGYVEATGELPNCARASWQTCADLLAAAEQADLEDF